MIRGSEVGLRSRKLGPMDAPSEMVLPPKSCLHLNRRFMECQNFKSVREMDGVLKGT